MKYLQAEYAFLKKCNNPELVKRIGADGVVEQSELSSFYKAYNTNENDYHTYISSQRILMNVLETRYSLSTFPVTDLIDVLTPPLSEIYNPVIGTELKNCMGRYLAELAGHAAAALIAHQGCVALHVTAWGGFACHAAVVVIQGTADYISLLDFEECMEEK